MEYLIVFIKKFSMVLLLNSINTNIDFVMMMIIGKPNPGYKCRPEAVEAGVTDLHKIYAYK